MAGTFGMFAVFLGGPLVSFYPPLAVLVGAPLGYLAIRAARTGLRVSAGGIEVRGVYRTRRASWDQVEDVIVARGSSVGLRWRIPVIIVHSGTIRAEDLRTLREPSVVDDAVAHAKSLLALFSPDSSRG
jgi:hypothetical protein